MAFENLLALAAEGDRATISEVVAKNPWLKKYAEQGEYLENLQPRVKALYEDGDISKAVTELERWREWHKKDWVEHQTNTNQIRQLLGQAQQRVAELEARNETEMTQEEVERVSQAAVKKVLAEAGLVNAQQLQETLTELVTKQIVPALDERTNGLTSRFEDVYARLTPRALKHAKDFDGEEIDIPGLFKFMKSDENKGTVLANDPIKAYDAWVAPRLQEKQAKEWQQKIEAARAEGKKEGLTQRAAAEGRSNPVDGRGPVKLGAVQMRRQSLFQPAQPKEGEKLPEPPLGKGLIAQRAAEAHRERELAGMAN